MAGHTISLYMLKQGHTVLGFDRTQSKFINSIVGDARDTRYYYEWTFRCCD